MELITANKLKQLAEENKKKFEQLLPELIKRLILSSELDVTYIRVPSGDDVWAPGFDGIVECNKESTYVCSGKSIWEFGTSNDSIEKINSDYEKRTKNPLGVVPAETTFYLVTPKIWAYKSLSITEWENTHTDWKKVKVYDATIICSWINSEPAVFSWLIEEFFDDDLCSISSVNKAWTRLANYTNPAFTSQMFLMNRKEQQNQFLTKLSNNLIKVKAQSMIDARGFVLSSLMEDIELKEKTIVIYNEKSYRQITSLVSNKILFLNFYYEGEVLTDDNKVIVCFNRESLSVKGDIEIMPLTKTEYIEALKSMEIDGARAQELFVFSHGNLRSLIRRIPGNNIERIPDWGKQDNIQLLAPVVFLRNIDVETDKEMIMNLSGSSFINVMDNYQKLLKLEDSPIKQVNNKYVIVNYEEAWDVLELSVNDYHFEFLIKEINRLLDEISKNGMYCIRRKSSHDIKELFYNLFLNFVYYSYEDDQNKKVDRAIETLLSRATEPNLNSIIIENLSILAEAAPNVVMNFMEFDITQKDSLIINVFEDMDYDHLYCRILSALEELARYSETIVGACNILFSLYTKGYTYRISNTPEDLLLNSLCLWNANGTATITQKMSIITKMIQKYGKTGAMLTVKILGKTSIFHGIRLGAKSIKGEEITQRQLFEIMERLYVQAYDMAIAEHDVLLVKEILENYRNLRIETLDTFLNKFEINKFPEEDVVALNYWLRAKRFAIIKFNWDNSGEYSKCFTKWINKTSSQNPIANKAWIFMRNYECPAYHLASSKYEYDIRRSKITEYRKAEFKKLREKYGELEAFSVIRYMNDERPWGYFIAEQVSENNYCKLALRLLELKKKNILAGMIDDFKGNERRKFLNSISAEKRMELLPLLTDYSILTNNNSEDEKRVFWQSKSMFEWDEDCYKEYLKYNPYGLVDCLYFESEKDIYSCQKKAEMTFNAIVQNCNKVSRHDRDEIDTTIGRIDAACYSDSWAEICLRMYSLGQLGRMPECVKIRVFNDSKIIDKIFSNKHDIRNFWRDYSLPKCAYEDYTTFELFLDGLIDMSEDKQEANYLIAYMLGNSQDDEDGWFPHRFVRKYLEKIDNAEVDRETYCAYVNSHMNFRTVSDGSDQKKKADSFLKKAYEIEAEYPHTAYIYKTIASDCETNAKHDYEYSELRYW